MIILLIIHTTKSIACCNLFVNLLTFYTFQFSSSTAVALPFAWTHQTFSAGQRCSKTTHLTTTVECTCKQLSTTSTKPSTKPEVSSTMLRWPGPRRYPLEDSAPAFWRQAAWNVKRQTKGSRLSTTSRIRGHRRARCLGRRAWCHGGMGLTVGVLVSLRYENTHLCNSLSDRRIQHQIHFYSLFSVYTS